MKHLQTTEGLNSRPDRVDFGVCMQDKQTADLADLARELAQLQNEERQGRKHRRSLVLPLFLDQVECAVAVSDRRPRYVQVGAHDGVTADPMFERNKAGKWDGLLLEPSTVYFSRLVDLYQNRPEMVVRNVGVSKASSQMTLYRVDETMTGLYTDDIAGCASLDRQLLLTHMRKQNGNAEEHICEETVQLEPLGTILTQEDVSAFDLLIVDVEGHEVSVFDSFRLTDYSPKLVWYENKHIGRKANRDLMRGFREQGYLTFKVGQDTAVVHRSIAREDIVAVASALGAVAFDD